MERCAPMSLAGNETYEWLLDHIFVKCIRKKYIWILNLKLYVLWYLLPGSYIMYMDT